MYQKGRTTAVDIIMESLDFIILTTCVCNLGLHRLCFWQCNIQLETRIITYKSKIIFMSFLSIYQIGNGIVWYVDQYDNFCHERFFLFFKPKSFLTIGYPSVRSLQTLSAEELCFEVNMNYTNKGVIPVMEYSILKNLFLSKFMDLVAYSNKRVGG